MCEIISSKKGNDTLMGKITLPHNHGGNLESILANMPDSNNFSSAASVFSQLGDATRLKILWLLCHTKECVSDIAAALGLSKAVVSHHLQLLRRDNLVTGERVGQEIHYSLSDTQEAKLLHKTIEAMFKITCPAEKS